MLRLYLLKLSSMCFGLQVPATEYTVDESEDEYELAHVMYIEAENLTSLNASTIYVAVSKAGKERSVECCVFGMHILKCYQLHVLLTCIARLPGGQDM